MPEADLVLERGGVNDEFRDMPLPTTGTAITESGIRAKEKADVLERGQQTARDFLQRWAGRP